MARASLCGIAALISLSSLATAQEEFVLPHMLEQDGKLVGIAWHPEGSQLTGRPVGQPAAAGLGAHVQRMSLYSNFPLFVLAADNIAGIIRSADIDITYVGKTRKGEIPNTYRLSLMTGWLELPACDVESKAASTAKFGAISGAHRNEGIARTANLDAGKRLAQKQKQWLPANFRLRIGTLDTTRVSKVKEVKVECDYRDLDGDGKQDVSVRSTPFVFTMPYLQSGEFAKLFEGTLAGNETVLPLRLEYLDEDGNPLLILEQDVAVWSYGMENVFAPFDPEASVQVVCEGRSRIRVVPTSQTTG